MRESDRTGRVQCGGFTLVELLVVTLILGVVIAAITSCLIGGIRTWEYVSKYGTAEVETLLKLETVHREVANTFPFYMISMSGGEKEISFPGLVEVTADGNTETKIGTIKYYFDQQKKGLLRKAWPFPESEPSSDNQEMVLSGLTDFTVSYYSLPSTNDTRSGVWQETWTNVTNLPGAVAMEISMAGDNKQQLMIKRTVMIQTAAASALVKDKKTQSKVPGR